METLTSAFDAISIALQYPFMQRALAGCLLVGLICAVIGVFVTLQNLAFIGQGVAQGSLPGLALGFALGVSLYLSALICAVILAIAIAFLRERGRIAGDTAIAIVFSIAAAIGIALIAAVRFGPADVNSYLFGNVLGITNTDLRILLAATVVLGGLNLLFFKEFAFIAFDGESAGAAGVPVRALTYLFIVMVAVTVVISLQTVGLILVTALLVIPAAAARQWADRLPSLMALSAAIGMGGGVVGLATSYWLRYPSGAMIVLAVGLVFVFSLLTRSIRDRRGRDLARSAA